MSEIAIVVSSIAKVRDRAVSFVVSDRHAVREFAEFSSDPGAVRALDWERLRARNFRRDPDDPGRFERYEAEALVYRHLPREAILGLACSGSDTQNKVQELAAHEGLVLKVAVRPHWFF